jgi:hypothetical protein
MPLSSQRPRAARHRFGDVPMASDRAPRAISSAAAPARLNRLCLCKWLAPHASAWALVPAMCVGAADCPFCPAAAAYGGPAESKS